MKLLRELLSELPDDLHRQVFTHASWTQRRSDSYTRLAFLGDSVLGLAVTAHLYPRLEADHFGAGRLTKIRAQAVSGHSCRVVAEELGVVELMLAAAPAGLAASAPAVIETERVLASVIEAVIGACYLNAGYEKTAAAVVEAFAAQIDEALEHPVDFKSTLQEHLARHGEVVEYAVIEEVGPPHERLFTVEARRAPPVSPHVAGGAGGTQEALARGAGRSKKHAEQDAARLALERIACVAAGSGAERGAANGR